MFTRRDVLRSSSFALFGSLLAGPGPVSALPSGAQPTGAAPRGLVKPARLKEGDTVGLVMPSFAQWDPVPLDILLDTLKALGLEAKVGRHVFDRRGYFAGRDEDRAADLNTMFADPEVKAVHCVRGGWGAARLLPLLDWSLIARNPKILVGYSDITALLLSFHARTGLVTFHGPVGASTWNAFNVDWMKRVLWNAEAATFANAKEANDTLVPVKNRTRVITPGKARGRLLGGNLTVFTTIIGSGYLPDFKDCILFLEDVGEHPYRVERMLYQLHFAGILARQRAAVIQRTLAQLQIKMELRELELGAFAAANLLTAAANWLMPTGPTTCASLGAICCASSRVGSVTICRTVSTMSLTASWIDSPRGCFTSL